MKPEELEQIRSNQAANREAARDNWDRAMVGSIDDLLAHIDQQAARISEFEAHEQQTHEILGAILGTDDSLEAVAKRAIKQIAALKEIATTERANLLYKTNKVPKEKFRELKFELPNKRKEYADWARQQLEAEYEVMR